MNDNALAKEKSPIIDLIFSDNEYQGKAAFVNKTGKDILLFKGINNDDDDFYLFDETDTLTISHTNYTRCVDYYSPPEWRYLLIRKDEKIEMLFHINLTGQKKSTVINKDCKSHNKIPFFKNIRVLFYGYDALPEKCVKKGERKELIVPLKCFEGKESNYAEFTR